MEIDLTQSLPQIKQNCITSWTQDIEHLDSRLISFDHDFEAWMTQFPDEYKNVVLTLVTHMQYWPHKKINECLKVLHEKLLGECSINENNTIYTYIKSEGGHHNSSVDYWVEYQRINNLSKYVCYDDVSKLPDYAWKYIENIIIIDDFGGTGDSLIKALCRNHHLYQNKQVVFITIGIMKDAIERIKDYSYKQSIYVKFINAFVQEKAFESNLFDNNLLAHGKVTQLSTTKKIPNKDIMGYKDSQSLVSFYNNTPNNTLGIIRYSNGCYKAIFPRRVDNRPNWVDLKRQKKERQYGNYLNAINEDS